MDLTERACIWRRVAGGACVHHVVVFCNDSVVAYGVVIAPRGCACVSVPWLYCGLRHGCLWDCNGQMVVICVGPMVVQGGGVTVK